MRQHAKNIKDNSRAGILIFNFNAPPCFNFAGVKLLLMEAVFAILYKSFYSMNFSHRVCPA